VPVIAGVLGSEAAICYLSAPPGLFCIPMPEHCPAAFGCPQARGDLRFIAGVCSSCRLDADTRGVYSIGDNLSPSTELCLDFEFERIRIYRMMSLGGKLGHTFLVKPSPLRLSKGMTVGSFMSRTLNLLVCKTAIQRKDTCRRLQVPNHL
jgi:hypothetical protein